MPFQIKYIDSIKQFDQTTFSVPVYLSQARTRISISNTVVLFVQDLFDLIDDI